jgi:sugar O-acyltransferase (sialic acid O-acetyltransferase NeuD family)
MSNERVVVLGAGGHAKVIISTLYTSGYQVEAVFDDDPTKHGSQIMGSPIKGMLSEAAEQGVSYGVIAVGDNGTRKAISERIMDLPWLAIVHPHAYVDPSVRLGEGTVVCAGVVLQAETVVGRHVIINTGATIDHDCVLGDFVHVAPGANLAGDVTVDEGVLIGIGSATIPGVHIGAWSVIGAGSAIVRDVEMHSTVVGVPGGVRGSTER